MIHNTFQPAPQIGHHSQVAAEPTVVAFEQVHAQIKAEFEAVIKQALTENELRQAGRFDSKQEWNIQKRLESISHVRKLPFGGDDEINIARRLRRLGARLKRSEALPPSATGLLFLLVKSYQAVQGGYYIFRRLTEQQAEKWQSYLEQGKQQSNTDLKRACEIALKGVPHEISDFYMKTHHVLVKASRKRVRLVSLHNIHGATSGVVELPSEAFSQPSKFREWLLNHISGATWMAGERELQLLQMDIARDLASKEIEEVAVRMYHEASKCWCFGDVFYGPDGQENLPDKNGIFRVKQDGLTKAYKLSEFDHEGQDFCQQTPKMHPKESFTDEELARFYAEMADNFFLTFGDQSAFLFLGCLLSFGAGPEIYKAFNGLPGLFVHGETRQGKSSVVRWGLKIQGCNVENGMPLSDSTKAGVSIAVQQYGEGMVWLEEWQMWVPPWMVEKIKAIHGRESGIKKTFDEERRKIISTVIITGVATCSDAQVKSRFVHVQVAAKNRLADRYQWFQENSPRFYLFGRHIMRHRKQFAERTLAIMREWMSGDMPGLDGRARLVYGAAYAAFAAFNELLPGLGTQTLTDLKRFAVAHAAESVILVNEKVSVNQLWHLVLDANASNAFGDTAAQRRRVFKWVPCPGAKSPVSAHQTKIGAEHSRYAWLSGRLYYRPSLMLDMLLKHLRQRGQNLPLDKDDLLAQMKTRGYWEPWPAGRRQHGQLFDDGSKSKASCWGNNVDEHELGLVRVSDEEFDASLHPEPTEAMPDTSEIWLAEDKWIDPRKGDLFTLIHSLNP